MIDKYDLFTSDSDLPISEEMLGAYLEGNLQGSDLRAVQNAIDLEPYVKGLMEDLSGFSTYDFNSSSLETGIFISNDFAGESISLDNSIDDLVLPEIEIMPCSDLDVACSSLGDDFNNDSLNSMDEDQFGCNPDNSDDIINSSDF